MPAEVFGEGYKYLPKPEILTLEEIADFARIFCSLGVEKLRLTGACGGCPHATMTIKQGIERTLRDQIDENIVVERVM